MSVPEYNEQAMERFIADLQSFAVQRGMELGVVVEASYNTYKNAETLSFGLLYHVYPGMAPLPPCAKVLNEEDALRAAHGIACFHGQKPYTWPYWAYSNAIGRIVRAAGNLYRFYGMEFHAGSNRYRALLYRLASGRMENLPMPKNFVRDVNRPVYTPQIGTWDFLSEEASHEVEEYLKSMAPRARSRTGNDRDIFKSVFA